MYFLCQLRKFNLLQFNSAIIESVITTSITVWGSSATKHDIHRLQCMIRSAEKTTGVKLPTLLDLLTSRIRSHGFIIALHPAFLRTMGSSHVCDSPVLCGGKIPLILIKQEMTWRDALRYCRENHVDLVSVLTNETQEWVETVTKSVSTPNVWMGLRHTRTLGFWYWVSGEFICYQNWAPENRTGVEDCSNGERSGAVQSGSKQWVSLPDTQKLNVICTIWDRSKNYI
ncbi:hypothetical protein P4O66_000976 [Electrophorus voltai]|uniref:C-type lectin domain-containing protein n=1 Tax=Electrophorus voltai TaxID=2609070 RepID=A0AAD8ZD76_9TELE|nr:hypothetical protein P4O66_000976 [Electrophorus voltai]